VELIDQSKAGPDTEALHWSSSSPTRVDAFLRCQPARSDSSGLRTAGPRWIDRSAFLLAIATGAERLGGRLGHDSRTGEVFAQLKLVYATDFDLKRIGLTLEALGAPARRDGLLIDEAFEEGNTTSRDPELAFG
jgi:hypothetical protein